MTQQQCPLWQTVASSRHPVLSLAEYKPHADIRWERNGKKKLLFLRGFCLPASAFVRSVPSQEYFFQAFGRIFDRVG